MDGDEIIKKYKCMFCGRTSSSESGILDHVRTKHTSLFVSKSGQQGARLYKEIFVAENPQVPRFEQGTRPTQLPRQPGHSTGSFSVPMGQGYSAPSADTHSTGGLSPVAGFGSYTLPNPSYSPVSSGFTLVPSGYDQAGQLTFKLAPAMPPPPPGFPPFQAVAPPPVTYSQVVSGVSSVPSMSDGRQSRPRTRTVPSAAQSRPPQVSSAQHAGTSAHREAPTVSQAPTSQRREQSRASTQSGAQRAPSAQSGAKKASSAQSRASSTSGYNRGRGGSSVNRTSAYNAPIQKILVSETCQCDLDFESGERGMKYRHMLKFHTVKSAIFVCRLCDCHFVSGQEFLGHLHNAHNDAIQNRYVPRPQDFATCADSTPYIRVILGSYLRLPYCKGCGYCHVDLYTKGIGCWCRTRRPQPGSCLDWKDKRFRVSQNILPKMQLRPLEGKVIPPEYVCSAAGNPFVPPPLEVATVARSQPESRAPKRKIPSPKAVSFPSDVEMREASSRESSPKVTVEAVASAVAHELSAQCNVSTVPPATSDMDLAPIEGPVERPVGAWGDSLEEPLPSHLVQQQPAWAQVGGGDGPKRSPQPATSQVGAASAEVSSHPSCLSSEEEGEVTSSEEAHPPNQPNKRKKRLRRRKKGKAKQKRSAGDTTSKES